MVTTLLARYAWPHVWAVISINKQHNMHPTLRLGKHISATRRPGSSIEQGIRSKNMQYATQKLPCATRLLRGSIGACRYSSLKVPNSLPPTI
jgi:hypothetical protein